MRRSAFERVSCKSSALGSKDVKKANEKLVLVMMNINTGVSCFEKVVDTMGRRCVSSYGCTLNMNPILTPDGAAVASSYFSTATWLISTVIYSPECLCSPQRSQSTRPSPTPTTLSFDSVLSWGRCTSRSTIPFCSMRTVRSVSRWTRNCIHYITSDLRNT